MRYHFSNNIPTYGEEHVSSKDDVFSGTMILIVMGVVFIIAGCIAFVTIQGALAKNHEFNENSTTVRATVSDIKVKTTSKKKKTYYYLMLQYTYDAVQYQSLSERLTETELSHTGYRKSNIVGKSVEAYIDKRSPSVVYLKRPVDQPYIAYVAFVFPLVGLIMMIWSIRFASDLKKGKYLVSRRRGRVRFRKNPDFS